MEQITPQKDEVYANFYILPIYNRKIKIFI